MTDEGTRRRHEETIVAVTPGFGASERVGAPDTPRPRAVPIAAIAIVLLLVLVGAVFFVLPGWVEQRAVQAPAEPAPVTASLPAPAAPVLSPEALAALEAQAESLLAELLQQRPRIEARAAASWAPDAWLDFEARSRAGDDALLAEQFQTAVEEYSAALAAGEALLVRADQLVATALATAGQAITAGDANLATDQYDFALGIEADHAAALSGKARAERLPDVLALVHEAEQLRQGGDLAAAAERYREALAVDPEWTPARTALDEVTARIVAARYDNLLSRGFAALADEAYADAEQHFTAALEIDPGSAAARDGLTQSREGQTLDAIALSEARALAFERRELWGEAVARYDAVLEQDPTMAFALAGLERARMRADLDSKLENLIANPNLLLTDRVLEDARRIVEDARPFAEPDTRIAGQVDRLDTLIRVASTPVAVQLQSDGLTEVTVYRVGPLGVFASTEIRVRPGTYTAVGSRDGYRDVRETFAVVPGRETRPISIVCSERI